MAALAIASPLPLLHRTETLRMPFLLDWNLAFMFLFSFPCLIVLTVTDDLVLGKALLRVQTDGVVKLDQASRSLLAEKWTERFRAVNLVAQGLGMVIGGLLAYFNYVSYSPDFVGYWIVNDGNLLPAGVAFLSCVFAFYAAIPIYIMRTIAVTVFLSDLVKHSTIEMLPFHPDRSGGLRPMGRLGLRNQYGLTVFGINIVLLAITSFTYLQVPPSLIGLIIAAGVAYVVIGPLAFLGPLLPFRDGMLRTKADLMSDVAGRLRIELLRVRELIRSGNVEKEDEELIERLRAIGAVIEELPVWPFDAVTLRKFVAAYVVPVIGALGYPFAAIVGSSLLDRFL